MGSLVIRMHQLLWPILAIYPLPYRLWPTLLNCGLIMHEEACIDFFLTLTQALPNIIIEV